MNKPTIADIENFCRSLNIGLDTNIESESFEVRISIRDGVHDEPPQSVYITARETMGKIREKFGADIKLASEVIDEFIDIVIKIKE